MVTYFLCHSKQLVAAVEGVELPFVEGFVAGTQDYAKKRTQSKTIAKLREASKGIPRPTKNRDRDYKDKGFEIDI